MRRITIFVCLKCMEILVFGFTFTGCSALGNILPMEWTDKTDIVWTRDAGSFIVCGICGVGVVIITSVALFIIYEVGRALIKKNWEWAGKV